mmetsp:Transcript_17231/g.51567  ORF Transcript_17231/g.51567 Transcript_17231/m.51567 type:complete len:224 (-) Transcript_17231:567-1238(-)
MSDSAADLLTLAPTEPSAATATVDSLKGALLQPLLQAASLSSLPPGRSDVRSARMPSSAGSSEAAGTPSWPGNPAARAAAAAESAASCTAGPPKATSSVRGAREACMPCAAASSWQGALRKQWAINSSSVVCSASHCCTLFRRATLGEAIPAAACAASKSVTATVVPAVRAPGLHISRITSRQSSTPARAPSQMLLKADGSACASLVITPHSCCVMTRCSSAS